MKRVAWSLVVAGLMASQGLANDPAGGAAPSPEITPVEVGIEATTEIKVDHVLVDPVPTDLQTLGGIADSQVVTMTATDGSEAPLEMQTMMLGGEIPANHRGGEQELSMNAAALGLPGLGDGRINLNAFGMFGEHRDSMRLTRDGQAVTARKVGLLQFFSRNKGKAAEPTVRTVSTTDRARAQKMAEIDKLRDDALKTGDRAKLAEADKLEAELNAVPAKKPSRLNPFRK
jgi:hypothetical protein